MKFLEKKIYGFTILEIGIGAFILMNLKTIFNFFGLVSKPIENAVDNAVDIQIQNSTGLSKQLTEFCKVLAPKIKVHLDKTFVDEEALCKLLGDSITSITYWDAIQKYYEQKYSVDLKSELYSVLNGPDDFMVYGRRDRYKDLLKRSYLKADLFN